MIMMDIIDTHVFYGRNGTLHFNYKIDDLIKARQKYQDHHNLKFIVISASSETNKNIADLVKDNPYFILGAHLLVVPRKDLPWEYTSPEDLSKLCERSEIKGLKIVTSGVKTRIDSQLLTPYIELAEDKDIPILFHCGATGTEYTSYEKIKTLAEKNPKLKMILAHFGGLNPNFIEGSINLAKNYPNIYLNTTGMSGEIKRYELRRAEPYVKEVYTDLELRKLWSEILKSSMEDSILSSKILFGTDYPELSHQLYPLDQLSQENQEKIMDNTRTLFKL